MRLPASVTIGPYTYPVVSDEATHIEHRILIDPHMSDEKTVVTLLHEVMHGCTDLAGNSDLDNEERIICALAPILLDTLRRNPDLVSALVGETAPKE
jgi:hypothetical protein